MSMTTLCESPIYQVQKCRSSRTLIPVENDLWNWLQKQGQDHQLVFLLGHTLDGVIWGRMFQDEMQIAVCENGIFTTEFDKAALVDLLYEIRLFSNLAELHLWRRNGKWQANLVHDSEGSDSEYIDEKQMLWGTQSEALNDHFTLMSDGVQGLYHAIPLPEAQIHVNKNGKYRPLRMQVRHYLAEDDTGRVQIVYSRLVNLISEVQEEDDGD